MKKLKEERVLTSISLTDAQKTVLTKIITAPTPKVASESIKQGEKLVVATRLLSKLGFVSVRPGHAEITDTGTQLLKDEGLMDESGQLTQDGQKFASLDAEGKLTAPGQQPETVGGELDAGAPPMEGFSILRDVNKMLTEREKN